MTERNLGSPHDGAPDSSIPAGSSRVDRRVHPAVWLVLVMGAFIALGGLWFAVFGGPQLIGTDPNATGGSSAASAPNSAATSRITVADVRAVLARLDYAESADTSAAEYNNTVMHVVAGVDVPAFARSTLDAASTIWWVEPGTVQPRTLSGAEKSTIASESIAAWSQLAASSSASSAIDAMFAVHFNTPTLADRTRPDSQLEVMAQGLAPLGLMFGANDADDEWRWSIGAVSITGPDSASVAFSASTTPRADWKFIDPAATYVKKLKFSRDATGVWRLSGWTNYDAVLGQFQRNVSPPDAVTTIDEWWGSL